MQTPTTVLPGSCLYSARMIQLLRVSSRYVRGQWRPLLASTHVYCIWIQTDPSDPSDPRENFTRHRYAARIALVRTRRARWIQSEPMRASPRTHGSEGKVNTPTSKETRTQERRRNRFLFCELKRKTCLRDRVRRLRHAQYHFLAWPWTNASKTWQPTKHDSRTFTRSRGKKRKTEKLWRSLEDLLK